MKANSSVLWNRAGHQMLGVAAALAIVLANVATAAGPAAAVGPTTASTQGGGPQEGIKVHGHWTIVVRNPDGTVATRHEFENSLHGGGDRYVASVLARQAFVGHWSVDLNGGICDDGTGLPADCHVAEPGFSSEPNVTPTLSISAPPTGPDVGKFVLSGSTRAPRAGTITKVVTAMTQCPATPAAAGSCFNQPVSLWFFTTRTLSVGIPVVAGQTIDVTVKISFS